MFNLDNTSAGIDRSTLQIDRRGNKPMAPRRLKTGQGFSLFDLKDVISDVTETLAAALNKQGVDVSTDNLFLQLQNLVQSVGSANGYMDPGYSGVMSASEKVPYSVAGDLLVIAYEQYKNGDRKEALKNILTAMAEDDFSAIANGLFLMNKKSDIKLNADDSDETEDSDDTSDEDSSDLDEDDNEDDADDNDTDEDTGDDDLEDSDIEDVISDADNESTASDEDSAEQGSLKTEVTVDDKGNTTQPKAVDTDEDEDNKEEASNKKPTPMGKTSSEMTASHTSKVLANRLSLDGSSINRAKARAFLEKNRNL